MSEFKPHDYFNADDQGYISRKVFIEHVRNTYDQIRELADYIKQYEGTIDTEFIKIVTHVNEHVKQLTDLYNDLLDNNILDSEIQEKLTQLEQNYAPRLSTLEQNDVSLTAQLQQTLRSSLRYGKLTMPEWVVPEMPCDFYRDTDGIVKHTMDFKQFETGTKLYVDKTSGSDDNDGSETAPYATLKFALRGARDGTDSDYTIVIKNDYIFYRNEAFDQGLMTFDGKKIAIVPEDESERIVLTTGVKDAVWTSDGDVFRTTRSATDGVYDLTHKDLYGAYIPYKNKETLSECQTELGSWYTDGSGVWVNPLDGKQPVNNIIVGIYEPVLQAKLLNGARLYYKNCDFVSTSHTTSNGVDVEGALINDVPTGDFIALCCTFSGGDTRLRNEAGNTFHAGRMKNVLLFDSVIAYGKRDGVNFDAPVSVDVNNKRKSLGLLYNCISYDHGLDLSNSTNNSYTAHNAMTTVLVGCIGYNTTGPVLANVDGCDTVAIDCRMRDSVRRSDLFQFYDSKDNGQKIYLENCEAGGNARYDLSSSVLPVYLKGFKGDRISGENITVMQ